MKKISILDATLREGIQSPNVKLNKIQSFEIAKALVKTNIQCLEIGHPYASKYEFERVQHIVTSFPNFPILSHARARNEDIKSVHDTGALWVGIFIGINELSRNTRLNNRTIKQIHQIIEDSIKYAKSLNLKVRFTIEDSSRTKIDQIINTYKVAINSGADRICYSDSVGCDTPESIYNNIRNIRDNFPVIDIEVHCHNDRGLAMANSLSAINSGANWISATVNGIGERCGITDTVTLLANLYFDYNYLLPEPKLLKHLSTLVSTYSRQPLSFQHPIVGINAFQHTAKLHIDAVKKDLKAYAWIDPKLFGRDHSVKTSRQLPEDHVANTFRPKIISATELKYHRHGPGERHVMIDERFIDDCRCYCIIRKVENVKIQNESHVDSHSHKVDSLFMFVGDDEQMRGLCVEVMVNGVWSRLESPVSVFIKSGEEHSYRFISGTGKFINFVFSGNYNDSLLEKNLFDNNIRGN